MSRMKIALARSSLTEAAQKAKEYHEIMKMDAEERIFKIFPERIVYLNDLLKKPEFNICAKNVDFNFKVSPTLKAELNSKDLGEQNADNKQHVDDDLPVSVPKSLTMPVNKHNCELIKILKPIIKQLIEDTNSLKIWVTLLIPKIEDGNNFGVSIQEDIFSEIKYVEEDAMEYMDQISRFKVSRAKLITQFVKFPYAEDYRRSVEELDERHRLVMLLNMHDIRNRYSNLHDIVMKNYEKIKTPRISNFECLY